MLKIGDKAPDFTLENKDQKEISLSDFLGKTVILYFYPKDNTPGCTNQACGFRDINEEVEELGAKIIGISKDKIGAHKKFVEKFGLNFELLADPEKKVHELYGVLKEKNMYGKKVIGTSRDTFIINPEGIIEMIYTGVKAKDNPFEVLDYIKNKK